MNGKLKATLGGFIFVDFGDMNALMFNVIQLPDDKYNLIMETFYMDIEDESETGTDEYGIVIRTPIVEDNLVDLGLKVKAILDIGIYDHLIFVQESTCMNIDGEEKYKFEWNDYISSTQMYVN
jgi:hypothetical protein